MVQGALKSKTMWFNAIVASLAAFEGVFNVLQPYVAGNVYAYITIALAVGNAFLRVLTTQALEDK
ncbi:MAG: hypothetical protein PHE88_11745 [Elusimicrobia bacterium]|nr:hypothetical protein [Elusimicrobiota bacterium]